MVEQLKQCKFIFQALIEKKTPMATQLTMLISHKLMMVT